MKKYLVLYYSKTGNSQFIAAKLAAELGCNAHRITPMFDHIFFLYLLSLLRINIPINITKNLFREYDEAILVGPIWGGQLISPLRTALKRCTNASKKLHFAVTCETKDEDKDTKYGYAQVLKKAAVLGGTLFGNSEAFSTYLVSPGKLWSPKPGEKIKITADNYDGPLRLRVEGFAKMIKMQSFQREPVLLSKSI
jgi:flavodoxin